jgi:lipopolysaccharide/colanic/teichoic acid biosynthesis glycosyltransferase
MKQTGWRRKVKRTVDVAVSGTALVVTSPIIAGAAVGIWATMGSPVIFRQDRPGQHGETIRIMKFRSMRDALPHEVGPDFDAARITRLGKFLRESSIDELPQLVNVLRGDMSLIGPRPLVMQYWDRYTDEQRRRHDVLPGLTGWAQVNGRNTISWEEKFAYDVWYVDNWSLRLDAKILAKTLLSVLTREGISSSGHATMPEFMGQQPAS